MSLLHTFCTFAAITVSLATVHSATTTAISHISTITASLLFASSSPSNPHPSVWTLSIRCLHSPQTCCVKFHWFVYWPYHHPHHVSSHCHHLKIFLSLQISHSLCHPHQCIHHKDVLLRVLHHQYLFHTIVCCSHHFLLASHPPYQPLPIAVHTFPMELQAAQLIPASQVALRPAPARTLSTLLVVSLHKVPPSASSFPSSAQPIHPPLLQSASLFPHVQEQLFQATASNLAPATGVVQHNAQQSRSNAHLVEGIEHCVECSASIANNRWEKYNVLHCVVFTFLQSYMGKTGPYGPTMSICANVMSKGVHNITFSVMPDTWTPRTLLNSPESYTWPW